MYFHYADLSQQTEHNQKNIKVPCFVLIDFVLKCFCWMFAVQGVMQVVFAITGITNTIHFCKFVYIHLF